MVADAARRSGYPNSLRQGPQMLSPQISNRAESQTVHYRQGFPITLFSLNRTEELRAGFGISVSDSCRLHLCHEKTG